MDQRTQVAARDLQKKLLRAQCEIDRRVLAAEVDSLYQRVVALREAAGRARQLAPWLAAGTALAGLVVARRGSGRLFSRLAAGIGLARRLTPWVPGFLLLLRRGSRRPGPEGPRSRYRR
jgi:hypothetical protein